MAQPPRAGMGVGKIIIMVVALAVAGLAVFIGANFQRIQEAARKAGGQPPVAAEPPPPLTPVQQAALVQYGKDLAQAFTDKDSDAVKAWLDNNGLADRVFATLAPLRDAAEMRAGFIKGASSRPGGWLWTLMEGEVVFLRTRQRLGFPAVLLRMKSDEGAVNYVDVIVRPDGVSFKAVDAFNYVFATTVSEEARNVFAVMSSGTGGGGGLAAMLGIPQLRVNKEVMGHFEAINKARQAGNPAEIVRICDALPAELKTQRMFFIIRLQALMALSSSGSTKVDEDYKQALRAAPDIVGKDSATDLLMVDLLFMENDFQGADDCLKRVEAVVGGDPYLKFLRGNARLQMKDYPGTLALADEAAKEDPKMAEIVDLRLGVHLGRKDNKAMLEELRAFKKNFGATLDRAAMAGNEVYKDFLASPEFAIWEKEIAAP